MVFLAVRSSLKFHSSTLALGLTPAICQWKTLDILFTKLLLNPIQNFSFRGFLNLLHIPYNDETWQSYTLRKEVAKNI